MIREKITEIYKGVIGSLDNKKNTGFSARKITVLVVMVCIILIHLSWLKHAFLREDYEYIIEILTIDSLFVLLLLGIVTIEQITKLKQGARITQIKK
jgi:nitrogen fixation/metabolism regulation signal transduction histidine kinase